MRQARRSNIGNPRVAATKIRLVTMHVWNIYTYTGRLSGESAEAVSLKAGGSAETAAVGAAGGGAAFALGSTATGAAAAFLGMTLAESLKRSGKPRPLNSETKSATAAGRDPIRVLKRARMTDKCAYILTSRNTSLATCMPITTAGSAMLG